MGEEWTCSNCGAVGNKSTTLEHLCSVCSQADGVEYRTLGLLAKILAELEYLNKSADEDRNERKYV